MSGCGCEVEIKEKNERGLLLILLGVNGAMFFVELIAGIFSSSSGLIADSLDMFADSLAYGSAFYAVGRSIRAKSYSALFNGSLQLVLGGLAGFDIIRRAFSGVTPQGEVMVSVSALALAANVFCLLLLMKHREGELHLRATWLVTRNDVLANLGVIAAGFLVKFTGSFIPDMVVGSAIVALVLHSTWRIFRDVSSELKKTDQEQKSCGSVNG